MAIFLLRESITCRKLAIRKISLVSQLEELSIMKSFLALGFIAIVSLPLAARASLITGVLNFGGSATISFWSIASNNNIFNINSPADTQQGGFMALEGSTGVIADITNPPDATGVPLDIPGFITFGAAPNISITLTFLLP